MLILKSNFKMKIYFFFFIKKKEFYDFKIKQIRRIIIFFLLNIGIFNYSIEIFNYSIEIFNYTIEIFN
jgi:hypothetical protein